MKTKLIGLAALRFSSRNTDFKEMNGVDINFDKCIDKQGKANITLRKLENNLKYQSSPSELV
jgi:hypothetical protein